MGSWAAVTVSVTATIFGLLEAAEAAIVTLPVYVPAAKPVGLTETVTLLEVVPLVGVAASHVADVVTV